MCKSSSCINYLEYKKLINYTSFIECFKEIVSMKISEFQDLQHKEVLNISASQIHNGTFIPPIKRIRIFESDEWEEFTKECLDVIKKEAQAFSVKQYAGAGDKGIDVALFYDEHLLDGRWECYQCKHFNHPLRFSEICVEFGKVLYYTFVKEYSVPEAYFFVSPYGCGTELATMLSRNTQNLKKKVLDSWDKYCKENITSTKEIPLDAPLKAYIEQFDFRIFQEKSPSEMIELHSKSKYHILKFGTGLPVRPENKLPPKEIESNEVKYINKLLEAYREHLGNNLLSLDEVKSHSYINKHLNNSREEFFSAESLYNFSRDIFPDDTFENLKEEIYHYIENTIYGNYGDGFEKVKKVIEKAHDTPVTFSPLGECVRVRDKAGICHQLANEDKIDWVQK